MTTPQAGQARGSVGGPGYWIDPARFEELRRSMEVLLVTRRCSTCLEQDPDIASPPSVDEQIAHIAECCAQDESFIKPGMPLQEIVFRMILAGGNTPIALSEIHSQVVGEPGSPGKWSKPENPMNVSEGGLRRILENDDYYGFRLHQPAGSG